eukprot:m.245586 g.245586  ORF g.245586 m.245586 type:complete len:1015 (+) comp33837_c3_seq28:144-3188(+)
MFLLLTLLLGSLASTIDAQFQCANSACISTVACNALPVNQSQWTLKYQTIDGLQAVNIVLTDVHSSQTIVNCPNSHQYCHAWGPGFGDRNGVFLINGSTSDSFVIQSWPATKSLPVGPNQTPPGQCLATGSPGGIAQPGIPVEMTPCSETSLRFKLETNGQLSVLSSVPIADPLCLGSPPPAPPPPPSRPNHYFSCTANLAGGSRLSFPFCNTSLSLDERLDDLVARATCAEKALVMTSNGSPIPRLGVPMLGSAEDTHGVDVNCIPQSNLPAGYNATGCATTFPNGPGLGASFNRKLWTQIGATIGREARGMNNMRASPLYFLDPDINLLRDPRWGRAQEVPGEDPFLTGEYGTYIIRATQESDADPRYMQAASTMKHFQVYDLEGYQPNAPAAGMPSDATCDGSPNCGRGNFDAYPTQRDFSGYYMGAFKAVAQRAQPAAIMCAYNAIYGEPSCASTINNDIARDEWGWDGFVISDCGAVSGIQVAHHYTNDPNATIAAALNQGGVDVNCGDSNPTFYTQYICDAVANGSVTQSDVDRGVRRMWKTMFKLGMFDPMETQPLVTSIGVYDVDSEANRALAQQSAAQGIVLLKNQKFLPMDGSNGRLDAAKAKFAFIGPLANATQDLLSAPQYHGQNILVNSHSPLQVAIRRGWDVSYARGCNICDWTPQGYPNQPCSHGPDGKNGKYPPPDTSQIAAAVAAAKAADVAILFLGADQTTEAENFDRVELGLVGAQELLLQSVLAVQPNVIVVLIHGGPIAVESAVAAANVKAIVDAFQPGELGADAVMDILQGMTSPSALMPYTTYLKNFTSRDIREVDLKAGRGTTYWWHTDPVLFQFGFGLSYTNFTFKWTPAPPSSSIHSAPNMSTSLPKVPVQVVSLQDITKESLATFAVDHSVTVTNTGTRTSDVVALAFVLATSDSPPETPLRKLFGFERFSDVKPGESRTGYFASTATSLGVVGNDGVRRLHPGTYRLECGGSGATNTALHDVRVVGNTPLLIEPNVWGSHVGVEKE